MQVKYLKLILKYFIMQLKLLEINDSHTASIIPTYIETLIEVDILGARVGPSLNRRARLAETEVQTEYRVPAVLSHWRSLLYLLIFDNDHVQTHHPRGDIEHRSCPFRPSKRTDQTYLAKPSPGDYWCHAGARI
jgi:hypothetical protein